jgi:hypothetical protein
MLGKKPILDASPASVRDLRKYTELVLVYVAFLPTPLRYLSDGKLRPTMYGANQLFDLGLCYEVFFTLEPCRLGSECFWRHAALTDEEVAWMYKLGAEKTVEKMDMCYLWPRYPEPSAWPLAG